MQEGSTSTALSTEHAETLGLQALGWIAGQPDMAEAFLTTSGLAADDMKARATDPEFLGFVLDFLLADEAALVAFCEDQGLPADQPMRARAGLPGGQLPHWT
ncbi:MAG: DUF3572 domain-containing protein [Pseudomonadota bacterium]